MAILKIQYGRQNQKFTNGNMVFQIPGALSFPIMYSFANLQGKKKRNNKFGHNEHDYLIIGGIQEKWP